MKCCPEGLAGGSTHHLDFRQGRGMKCLNWNSVILCVVSHSKGTYYLGAGWFSLKDSVKACHFTWSLQSQTTWSTLTDTQLAFTVPTSDCILIFLHKSFHYYTHTQGGERVGNIFSNHLQSFTTLFLLSNLLNSRMVSHR